MAPPREGLVAGLPTRPRIGRRLAAVLSLSARSRAGCALASGGHAPPLRAQRWATQGLRPARWAAWAPAETESLRCPDRPLACRRAAVAAGHGVLPAQPA